ncbi:MFS transporter [Gaoshiqia sp. Z1-71]|uniref:MFS transporter n=1 Tax=Gaoshiqia hydrogeniformans TaxID=3290090 RepID=UPI003BF84E4D
MKMNRFSTKAALLLVSSLTVMAGATIAPALPSIQAHFRGVNDVGLWVRLIFTMPALFIVLAAPLAGWFLDRNGRLRLLIPSMILYGIGGSSGIYLDSIGAILAGRALLGIAVAGIMTSATTLVADYYEGQARSRFMGWQAAFMSFGGVIFLTTGGALTEVGWRWPFTIYLFSIVLIPLVISSLSEPVSQVKKANTENTAGEPVVKPVRLLTLIYGVAFGGMVIFYFVPLQIPFYLKTLVGAGPTASGMAIAVATLSGMVISLFYSRVRARMDYISILSLNFGLMGTGYLLIGLGDNYLPVLAGLAVSGLGTGLMFPNLNVWLTSEVPEAFRGRAVGGLTTAIFLGQFMSPVAGQPIAETFGLDFLFRGAGVVLLSVAFAFVLLKQPIRAFVNIMAVR